MNARNDEDAVTLEILRAVDGEKTLSQRGLATRLGVALGLANSYLRRCARKGLIKIKQAPANRYVYYLTPKGFAEKSRLTLKYLSASFSFYRTASESCNEAFVECRRRGWQTVLLCGISELAEIASLRAEEQEIDLLGSYDPTATTERFLGLPVWARLAEVPGHDACLLTDLRDPATRHGELTAAMGEERILVPALLQAAVRRRETKAAMEEQPAA